MMSLLWSALEEFLIIPSKEDYLSRRSNVSRIGALEYKRIVAIVGEKTWNKMIPQLHIERPEDALIRVAGFGNVLTRFVLAPLKLPAKEEHSIARLGTLANLLVTVFDRLADSGISLATLLPRWLLVVLSKNKGRMLLPVLNSIAPANTTAITRMVQRYFSCLAEIARNSNRDSVYNLIRKYIIYMFDVECMTISRSGNLQEERILKEKAALPFVILGMPGWLTEKCASKSDFQWHIKWLYQLGEFFGWIDDFVDYNEDMKTGQSNRVIHAMKENECNFEWVLARRIAKLGHDVISEWSNRINGDNSKSTQEAFSTCLISWLGGLSSIE
ncbi:MAG: hypothetical protein ACFFD6_07025 [Candidatus Thorarchaeota archaeon]